MNEALSKAKEALAKIDQAREVVNALSDGRINWTMSVPARPDSDPDLVIAGALKSAQEALSALSALQEARPVAWLATDLDGRGDVGFTKEEAKRRAGEGCTYFYPLVEPVAHPQPAQQDVRDAYYIVAYHHDWHNGKVLFWGPDCAGYTCDLDQAGVYTAAEALSAVGGMEREDQVFVPVDFIKQLRVRRVVDQGDSKNTMFWTPESLRAALAAAKEKQ